MKKFICIMLSILTLIAAAPLTVSATDTADVLTVYPEYDSRILRCYDYGVTVTQNNVTKELTVYNQNTTVEIVSSRTEHADNERRFCEFAFSGGEVRVDITVYGDFESYSVLPSAKNYRNSYSDGVISVWLDSPGEFFMIELDNEYSTVLSVFADEPENYAFDKNDSSVLVLDRKWYEPENGIFTLPAGVNTVYIAPGTVLCARMLLKKAGLTVCGHGIILDPWSNIYEYNIDAQSPSHFFSLNAANITARDVKLLDAQTFNICIYGNADGARISNVKILSIRMCTDGISLFGADDVTVDHCFVYNGDNALVFGDGGNNVFNDCYLGTTCAAVFPQSSIPGTVTLNNTYIFRCDQGAVNNWYNSTANGAISRPVANVTFNGLSCIDVVNFPWLFSGRNMGTEDKFFYFNDVQIPYSRGVAQITYQPNGKAVILSGSPSYMDTYNYHLSFNNLTSDGSALTDASQIGAEIIHPEKTYINVSRSEPQPAAPVYKVNHTVQNVYPYKVYIGGSLQEMSTQPFVLNGKLMLPLAEICTRLGKDVPADCTCVKIGNTDMVSAEECSAKIADVFYNFGSGKISFVSTCDTGINLLAEKYGHLSRWNELICYLTNLTTYVEDGVRIYKSNCSDSGANDNQNGMVCMLTDEIKKYGPLKYRLGFTAKSTDGTEMYGRLRMLFPHGGKSISEDIVYEGDWTDYEIELDLTDINTADCYYACLEFLSAGKGPCRVLFKNISLTACSFSVTYRANDKMFIQNTVSAGLAACEPSQIPTSPGKVFNGWYTDEGCTHRYDFSLPVNEDTVLYAGFTEALTVTLHSGDITKSIAVGRGQTMPSGCAPVYDGLYFAGYFTDRARTQVFTADKPVTEDITLYAGYYRNIYDSGVQDYGAYIANSNHALNTDTKVGDDETANNRTTFCTVEANTTYEIVIDMDCRFRGGAVETVKSGKTVTNFFQHELDTNEMTYIGGTRKASVTTGENQTTLLIFYWTKYSGCKDFLSVRQSIAVYNPSEIITPPGNEDDIPDAPAEPEENPQPGENQSFFNRIAEFFRRILNWFIALFK